MAEQRPRPSIRNNSGSAGKGGGSESNGTCSSVAPRLARPISCRPRERQARHHNGSSPTRAAKVQPAHLAQCREVRVGEERRVADKLVHNVGLRGVEGARAVPKILRAVEHAQRQAVEEAARGQQASRRPQRPPCLQEVGDLRAAAPLKA